MSLRISKAAIKGQNIKIRTWNKNIALAIWLYHMYSYTFTITAELFGWGTGTATFKYKQSSLIGVLGFHISDPINPGKNVS